MGATPMAQHYARGAVLDAGSRLSSDHGSRGRFKAPDGAPNIVLILLDDVGFGATSVTGGPVSAPALDRLAAEGLRYNEFHVNSPCSPTRAALLSGRNDHETGFGSVFSAGFPGYDFQWRKSAASIAEVLRRNGYSTSAFGKWHNTPQWEIMPVGPFDRWPTSLGFEYFYGFLGARIVSNAAVPPGDAKITVEFQPEDAEGATKILATTALPQTHSGVAKLFVNGHLAGEGRVAASRSYYQETLDIGADLGTAVSPSYASPFRFTGHIESVKLSQR